MSLKRGALLPFALTLLFGCEYDFPLKSIGDEDRLSVVAVANQDGTMFINVETAVPINKYAPGERADTSLTKLELTINGRQSRLFRLDSLYGESSLSTLRFWQAAEAVRPGDEVSIAAQGATTKEVTASFKMPSAPVIGKVDAYVQVNEYPDLVNLGFFDTAVKTQIFKVTVADASEDDYYGIQLVLDSKSTFIYEDIDTVKNASVNFVTIEDAGSGDSAISYETNRFFAADYDGITANRYVYGNQIFLFSGASMRDGAVEFSTYYSPSGSFSGKQQRWEQDPETGEYSETDGVKYSYTVDNRYRIVLYKVSDEFYHYCKSLYMIENNLFAEVGLSPTNFSYTNISGGFGVLGGLSCTQSDWIPAPVEAKE